MTRVGVTGLTRVHGGTTFSVVAYDEKGDVIGGLGIATDGIVCADPDAQHDAFPEDLAMWLRAGGGCLGRGAPRAVWVVSRRFVNTRCSARLLRRTR